MPKIRSIIPIVFNIVECLEFFPVSVKTIPEIRVVIPTLPIPRTAHNNAIIAAKQINKNNMITNIDKIAISFPPKNRFLKYIHLSYYPLNYDAIKKT